MASIMETQTAIVLFTLVAVFGLATVVAVDIMLTAQEADAVSLQLRDVGQVLQ